MSLEKENQHLTELAEINKNASEFYEDAAETAKDKDLQDTFKKLETLHSGVVVSLEDYIRQNGGSPDIDETLKGQIIQFWGEMKTKFSSNPDEILVGELEEAEDRCLHKMQDIMSADDVSGPTKTMLTDEYQTLRRSHDYMKSLKDIMKAA